MSRTIKQTTAPLPPSRRFEYWQDTILAHVDLALRTDRNAFACERLVSAGAQSVAIDTRSTPFALERQRQQIARDGLDFVGLGTLIEGVGQHGQGGRDIVFAPGDLFISDFGRPCRIATGDVYREARINVDRALFEARVGPASLLGGLRLSADAPLVVPFTAYFAAYVAAVPSMQPVDAEAGLDGVLHLLAGLIRRSSSVRSDEALTPAAIRDLAGAYIGQHLTSPALNADAMVRDLGISRTRLYAAFVDSGGIRAAILEARLRHVRARLRVPGGTIEEIAFAAGFRDYAAFSRAFRRAFGVSPRDDRLGRCSQTPKPPLAC